MLGQLCLQFDVDPHPGAGGIHDIGRHHVGRSLDEHLFLLVLVLAVNSVVLKKMRLSPAAFMPNS
jgi:hypothetical protein